MGLQSGLKLLVQFDYDRVFPKIEIFVLDLLTNFCGGWVLVSTPYMTTGSRNKEGKGTMSLIIKKFFEFMLKGTYFGYGCGFEFPAEDLSM